MNKNPIRGDDEQDERAHDREAPNGRGSGVVNRAVARRRAVFLPGEISPHARKGDAVKRSEKSAEAVVADAEPSRDPPNLGSL